MIDATCGNGHDSLLLGKLALTGSTGTLYCIDIQQEAIESTRRAFYASENFSEELKSCFPERIKFVCGSHESFPEEVAPNSVALIAYNLGYLPGQRRNADEAAFVRTEAATTLSSIGRASELLKEGGLLSVTAYPGHEGGEEELLAVQSRLAMLDADQWRVHSHAPLNRPLSPTLFLAFKIEKFSYYKQPKKKGQI